MQLSVILCTHDPGPEHLHRTLAALHSQMLPLAEWALILVDTASSAPLHRDLIAWHPQGRLIREEKLGLTHARARGIEEARSELLVFCDDDNLLMPDYLSRAVDLFATHKNLGAAGGKSLPAYASPPPGWIAPFLDRLAVRDLGDKRRTASWTNLDPRERTYPPCSPIGAGLVLRRQVAREYV
jgi:glycosyltransferase involved in cell wall biosynthesis